MKILLSLIVLLVICSCTSSGVRLSDSEKSKYKNVEYIYSGEYVAEILYTRKPNEQFYYFHDPITNQRLKTGITSFNWDGRIMTGHDIKAKKLFVFNKSAPLGIASVVNNVERFKSRLGKNILYIKKNGNGYLVRTNNNGQEEYQYVGKYSQAINSFKAKLLRDGSIETRFPYVNLGNGLVYPALFDGDSIRLKPRSNVGFQGFELEGDTLGYAVFNDQSGNKFYTGNDHIDSRGRLFRPSDDKSEYKIEDFLDVVDNSAAEIGFTIVERDIGIQQAQLRSVEPQQVDFVKSLANGKYIFLNSKGHLSYNSKIHMNKIEGGRLIGTKEFDSIDAAKAALAHNNIRVASILKNNEKARQYQKEMDAYMEKNKAVFAARRAAREKRQAELDYKNAQAKQNSKNRARFSDIDFTAGVDVEASKAQSKCIQKRTETKKAYVSGKQGWYSTGGCQ